MEETLIEMMKRLRHGIQPQALDAVDTAEWTGCELVPAHLRAKSPESFQNKGLELGLHHHRTSKKSPLEMFKFDVARILQAKLALRKSSWDHFTHLVVGDVNRARRAYAESSARFSDDEVYDLLALDALFLVILFKYANGRTFFLKEFADLAGRLREIPLLIDKTDFFLIENQVPMYLLQSAIRQLCEIDEETLERRHVDPTFRIEIKVEDELEMVLIEAVLHLNPFTYPEKPTSSSQTAQSSRERLRGHLIATYPVEPSEKSLIKSQHLLDCVYKVICGHSIPFRVDKGVVLQPPLENIPSATRLEAVGVCIAGAAPTLRDVRLNGTGYFKCANLELPRVELYDYSEAAFHNLALHEQRMSEGLCGDLRCYLKCMASLCISCTDLQLLSEQGVINSHTSGNHTLTGMWGRTLRGVFTPYPSSSWVRVYRHIHSHRNTRLKRWRAEFWALFFAKPWTLVSVLAAIVLLFLTTAQTWFTVYPR